MATIENNVNKEEFSNLQTKFEAYTGNEPYLFISYSHRDSEQVYPILDALYDRKYRMWYDESCETGNDFRDELRQRIEKCEAVILFVSEASMNSPFCGMEIIVARENGKRLYPVYLDAVDVPPAFSILLANTHHGTANNLDKHVKQMIRDRQEREGWDFIFLGANMDAIAVAADMGIQADRAVTAMADAPGVSLQYEAVADANASYRQTSERSASWKRRVEEDTACRGFRR